MLIQRIITGGVFGVAVVAAILLLPSVWAGLVLGALWLAGFREWARFARLGTAATIAWVAGNAVAMVLIGELLETRLFVEAVLGIAAAWWLAAAVTVMRYPRTLSGAATLFAGLATLLPSWGLLAWLHSTVDDGPLLLLALLAIVWSADTGAFFVGRAFGRRRLAPKVSPGKTWEGVAGGLTLAGAVGAFAGYLSARGIPAVALVAVATAAVSVMGDLTVSMFKRNAGLKDSGGLLPGHGGVLDRIDSVTAAVAMFVLGLLLVGIIT